MQASHRPTAISRPAALMLAVLLALLALHVTGVLLDLAAAFYYRFELDYGEGLVWQQAALIPGPRMYAVRPGLPFIVFNYPPVYFLFAHLARGFTPDLLAAGRLVSALSAIAIGPLVAILVLIAVERPIARHSLAIAVAAGLLAMCLHAVRSMGMVMRVDMLGVAFSMAAMLSAAWADGRWRGTAVALLLCVAAVFTKQIFLSAGAAIVIVALLRRPRDAAVAIAIAGTAALAALSAMQWLTQGGFLQNVVGYNLTRVGLSHAAAVFWPERGSALFAALMLAAFIWLAPAFRHVRAADRAGAARAMLLLQFALATAVLCGTALRPGGNFYYTLEWLATGCVLIGVTMVQLWQRRAGAAFVAVSALLAVGLASQPVQQFGFMVTPSDTAAQEALVKRIAAADKPVASENMTLLMRAGKPVLFEPFIATELASVGRWDETELVQLIRNHGLAFVIVMDDLPTNSASRSPAVDAAMRAAYPYIELAGPHLWVRTTD